MKTHYLFLLTALMVSFGNKTTAQNTIPLLKIEQKLKVNDRHYDSLIAYLNHCRQTYQASYSLDRSREIIDDFFEKMITLQILLKEEGNISTYKTYHIKLVTQLNKVVYYRLTKPNFLHQNSLDNTEKILKESYHIEHFKILNAKYYQSYRIDLDTFQLFLDDITYGSECGNGGAPPKYRLHFYDIIDKPDLVKLKKWLTSPVVELQLYAIEAIYYLKKKGQKFDPFIKSLIKVIKQKKGAANVCSGCFYSKLAIKEVVKRIRKYGKY